LVDFLRHRRPSDDHGRIPDAIAALKLDFAYSGAQVLAEWAIVVAALFV
jgi:hypothetical protein